MDLEHRPADSVRAATRTRPRQAYADNLKVLLVAGVIVGHASLCWTGIGIWVFEEPPVREPLLSIVTLAAAVGSMFAMPLFFLIAGVFTAVSLARKGPRRFLVDRALRLGVPMLFYIVALSPIIEYADPDAVGWDRGFGAFALHIWWPPAPGPTWFLGVLLVFSIGYTALRSWWPRQARPGRLPPGWGLAAAAAVTALASYAVRFGVPLGEEHWRLALGQAPGWVAGFALGVLAGEGGWLAERQPRFWRRVRQAAWAAAAACVAVVVSASALGVDIEVFAGDGTWQSALEAAIEGTLLVAMSLWLLDVFRRRFDRQGRLAREMSRGAYAAFVLHQLVLVGLVLGIRQVPWPPEVEYLSVAVVGVAASFTLGSLAARLPGLSRVV